MKLLTILLFCFSISTYSSQTVDQNANDSTLNPIEVAEGIALRIIKGKREMRIKSYFSEKELKEFLKSKTPAIPESIIQEEIDNYAENLKKFKTSYANNFRELNLTMSGCAEINWKKCVIDSVTYEYQILVPQAQDQKITWPESKNYQPNAEQMTSCKANVFISENEIVYVMQVEFWIFNNQGKFYHNIQSPRIAKLN